MTNPVRLCAVSLVMFGAIGLVTAVSPALALDCKTAARPVDKLICKDGHLTAAWAKLDAAYDALLKQAPDEEIRSVLMRSQQRWHEALDLAVDMVAAEGGTSSDETDEATDTRTPGTVALNAIQSRIDDMTSQTGGMPTFIAKALKQRDFNSKFSSGKFAGYDTGCYFLPPDFTYYACFATQHFQNGTRICSAQEYWASGSVYDKRFVADVIAGEPKLIASCTFNGSDTSCLGDADGQRWNLHPQPQKGLYPLQPLPKLDPEIDRSDGDWLEACLKDPAFPGGDPTRPGEKK